MNISLMPEWIINFWGWIVNLWGWIVNLWGIINPFVELIIIWVICYYALLFLKGTRAFKALIGIIITVLVLVGLTKLLHLEVISWLLSTLWPALVAAIVLSFQAEIRNAFVKLGSKISFFIKKQGPPKEAIEEIANAMTQMSFRRCGALIVFEGQISLVSVVTNAVQLDAKVNSLLLQSLFYPNSPLHDGALIIREGRIVAAHAILPLSQETQIYKIGNHAIGTRHRAAIGISEETDAVAIVVSEETGMISIAFHGRLTGNLTDSDLLDCLRETLMKQQNINIKKSESVSPDQNRKGK